MVRTLPSEAEARRILARRRTLPVRRGPPPAGRALTATLKVLEGRFGPGADGLKARWGEIVGQLISQRTEPVRLSASKPGGGASLEIRVDGPSATLVQHQAGDILARVNLYLGAGAVERLRIVQGRLQNRPRARPTMRVRARPPLDAAQEDALAAGLAKVPEGPLREALRRLGREVLRGSGP